MYYDNHDAIFLANNPTFYKFTKHIRIDCHSICHWAFDRFSTTPHVGSSHQLVDILTKKLSPSSYDSISCKVGDEANP